MDEETATATGRLGVEGGRTSVPGRGQGHAKALSPAEEAGSLIR